jgi:hypothetical protein
MQAVNLLAYDRLITANAVDDVSEELQQALSFETLETADPWYAFDQFMLIADRHDAFLIDLSGEVTPGEWEGAAGTAEVPAEVEGVDGEVAFRLVHSATGRWRVRQVIVPGGDTESIPWSVPAGGS